MGKNIQIVIKLDKLIESRGMTQGKLAEMTGLRPSTISEITRGTRSVLNKEHLAKIAEVLGITDISELLEIRYEEKDR
ncbi:helix-turn-helix domain-containing protein [Paenibacillus sp. OAS669]|uniref:helix-turn-helix domain-containing protein n=1 Tax=Paenibacillus sp. OAS669 TaxID=2663821 RepID=UPI00178AF75C|nr:helix-turn-helix transcriptional regulator [Paenibacillus sp. OAS669]MBE1443906.1 transcriptional regulator with XRE-family HTH domain [Paenibacillus sp. OAS669]